MSAACRGRRGVEIDVTGLVVCFFLLFKSWKGLYFSETAWRCQLLLWSARYSGQHVLKNTKMHLNLLYSLANLNVKRFMKITSYTAIQYMFHLASMESTLGVTKVGLIITIVVQLGSKLTILRVILASDTVIINWSWALLLAWRLSISSDYTSLLLIEQVLDILMITEQLGDIR